MSLKKREYYSEIRNIMRTYKGYIKKLKDNQILLFGGNPEFRHGKGNALLAVKIAGAIYGKGGIQGNSICIITKDLTKRKHPSVSKEFIIQQIGEFYIFAEKYWDLEFLVIYSGTGTNLNGYSNKEMAEMFSVFEIPENVVFEEEFSKLLIIK